MAAHWRHQRGLQTSWKNHVSELKHFFVLDNFFLQDIVPTEINTVHFTSTMKIGKGVANCIHHQFLAALAALFQGILYDSAAAFEHPLRFSSSSQLLHLTKQQKSALLEQEQKLFTL